MREHGFRMYVAAITALLVALPAAAATEERPVSGFHGIAVSVPAHVTVIQGKEERATLTADRDTLAKIETVVDGGVLRVRFANGADVHPTAPITLVVRLRSLDSVATAGTVTVEVPRLEGERLAVNLAGSGRIVLPDLKLGELSIDTSGHAHGLAIGRVDALEVHAAGEGEINAVRLDAKRANVRLAGSAKVVAWVRDRLDARISGSGSVTYFGDPEVSSRVSGSGWVRRTGAAPP